MSIDVNFGNVIKNVLLGQDEVDYIKSLIIGMPENGKMVEWGSGGSTCLWLETLKPTQNLITIEHNENWHMRVQRAIKNHFNEVPNFTFFHKPEKYGFEHGYGNIIEEHPCGTDEYLNPTNDMWDANIYFIDGIARATCLMVSLFKNTNPNATFLIHDYVGREMWYDWATQFCNIEVVGTTLAKFLPK